MDLDAATDRIMEPIKNLARPERDALRTKLRTALIDRRDLLGKLQTEYRRYFKNLQNPEFTEQQLANKANNYAEFLDGHLLWIRSAKIFGPKDVRKILPGLLWLVRPGNWWQVFQEDTGMVGGGSPFRDSASGCEAKGAAEPDSVG